MERSVPSERWSAVITEILQTRVLTIRIALAILSKHIRPENIVVVTFTNKAARELKERLADLIDVSVSRRIIVGTFHSVSLRFLQRYGANIGLGRITVADSSDSRNIVSKVLKKLRKADVQNDAGGYNESAEKQMTASAALAHISLLKSKGISCEMLPTLAGKHFPISLPQRTKHELEIVYAEYQAYLLRHNLLDFDDLIIQAIHLLRNHAPTVQRIEQVFVDEFQDTSAQQFELMRLLSQSREQVTIVGDHDQSIYGFRLADIANFKRMKQFYPDCVEFHLKQNYRSSGAIVIAASALIEQDSARPTKNLATENSLGPQPTLRQLQSAKTEADWLAKEVQRLLRSTGPLIQLEDFAVLVRSASLTLPIEQALQRNQIKYRLQNAKKFLERPHIRTLVDYLRVIHDETSMGLLEIVNVPSRGFGQSSLTNLQLESSRLKKSLWQTLKLASRGSIQLSRRKDSKMETRLSALIRLIEKLRDAMQRNSNLSMSTLLSMLIDGLRYESYLKQHYPEDFGDRMDDVREFMETSGILAEVSEEAELPTVDGLIATEPENSTLDRLLQALSLMSDAGNGTEENAQALTVSTIHSAKGLEWPIVFIPGVYHGSIPSARAMDQEQDEERRLLYVAMTRAKALLYMSFPMKNARYESTQLSSFLAHSCMTHLLESRGPPLNLRTIAELATLLKRSIPVPASIQISEDTYEDRSQEQLADEDYDLAFVNGKFLKRKKAEVPEGAESGFSTAGKYLRTMTPEETNHKQDKPAQKIPKVTSKPVTESQRGIKSFFSTIPVLPKQASLPLPSPLPHSIELNQQDLYQEDYRTIILSSSPEHIPAHIQRTASLPLATAPDSDRPFIVQTKTTKNSLSLMSNTNTVNATKPKKRLGMSRPRIIPTKPLP